jgi:dienelactone hydrolase
MKAVELARRHVLWLGLCFLVPGPWVAPQAVTKGQLATIQAGAAVERSLHQREPPGPRHTKGLRPHPDSSGPLGTWYLNSDGLRLTATIRKDAGAYRGTLLSESGVEEQLDRIRWDASTRSLEFRRHAEGYWRWYRGTILEGVLVGRSTPSSESSKRPLASTAYSLHVTGWNREDLDRDIVPRVYDLLIHGEFRATLRIDRASAGSRQFIGRLKVYATVSGGANGEEAENDLEVEQWEGTHLKFVRHLPSARQVYVGVAKGRTISGTFTVSGKSGEFPWQGKRSEVLSYGLTAKSPAERVTWQERTRLQLAHLMMADDPPALSRQDLALRANLPPLASSKVPANRDDDINRWKPDYRLQELQFNYTLANPCGGSPLTRRSHAYLAVPNSKPPGQAKFPAVLALNGHGGSAWKLMNPADELYWYGDSFARHGYVVLAVDISHRPVSDRAKLYQTVPSGDDPAHGNGTHPAVHAPGLDSDWEEDGERAWDVMRGLDYLLSLPEVDPKRILVAGLSMGGEVATLVGGLDPRVALTVSAGFSPDMGVITYHGNHPCWLWLRADIREYVSTSDLQALIAPRPLVVETGAEDPTFSAFQPPFASDKEVERRTRTAYGRDVANFLHYLHDDGHRFRMGGLDPLASGVPRADIVFPAGAGSLEQRGVRAPVLIEPDSPWSVRWQTDGRTTVVAPTLSDWIDQHLARR